MSRVSAEVGSAANSYEILAKLAMGGMAEIFLARGASTAGVERYVVLKRILRNKATDASFIRMFLDEARLAAQLQHPNIAQVYDIGKLGDSYFFTMEYVHGETVRTLLQRSHGLRRPIPVGSVLTVIAGSAAGLHHAHDRKGMDGKPLGIVHRDVSPSNLMVSYEGTVKVVDFGVAKAAHRDTETRSGTVKGKITYMSPEQCKGGSIDRRSDLFSLGIVMWEMLTTERLFRRNSDFENMTAIVGEEVPPPSALRPDIPPEIDAVVMKLLAKRVADRFQDGDEVHEAIENAAVRTGSALSTASLGRFMRELFGQRPEPWIELQSNDSHPEAFTVTSEPIVPNELKASPADELDMRLSAIPELRMSAEHAGAAPPPPPRPPDRPQQPTIPFQVQAEDLAVTMDRPSNPNAYPRALTPAAGTPQGPSYPTMPMPAASPMPPATQSFTHSHSQSAQHGLSNASAMRPHTPSLTPGSSTQYPMMQGSGHSYSVVAVATQKRSRTLIVLLPACVVGIIIGIALAFGGKKQPAEDPANTVALTPGRAEDPTAIENAGTGSQEPAVVPDTKAADPQPADKAADPQPADKAADPQPADTKPADPQPADARATDPQPPDTTAADPQPTDPKAADPVIKDPKAVAPRPVDSKPDKKPRKDPAPPKDPPKDTPVARDDVATLFKANKHADVVSHCSSSPKIVALNSTACTLSACKTKDAAKAKKWLSSVGSAKRSSVIKDCAGVIPAEKLSNAELCKREPLACQH